MTTPKKGIPQQQQKKNPKTKKKQDKKTKEREHEESNCFYSFFLLEILVNFYSLVNQNFARF